MYVRLGTRTDIQYIHPELLKKSYKVLLGNRNYQFCTLRCSGLNESHSYTVGMLSTYSAVLYIYITVLLRSTLVLYTLSKQMQNLPLM